jgi:hypothetical protein
MLGKGTRGEWAKLGDNQSDALAKVERVYG